MHSEQSPFLRRGLAAAENFPGCRQGKMLKTEGLERCEGLEDGGRGHSRRVQAALGS